MSLFAGRGLVVATALGVTAALAGGGLAGSASAAPAAKDPTITIRVGGLRTAQNGPPGPPAVTGLAGVTFRASPATAGQAGTCVSTAAGLCTLHVSPHRTYTVSQVGAPAGWFGNPALAAGNAGNVTPHSYNELSVTVSGSDVTVPVAASNGNTSPTARSGMWALSKDNPPLPQGCGLRIALLIDLSSSITSSILPTYKAAARAFVQALQGTPSSVAIYTFGTTGPAPGADNANLVPVSVASPAGVTTLVNKINGLTVPSRSGTNWDAGFWQIVRDNTAYHYQTAVILTDGDATYYGPSGSLGGTGSRTRFAETENGVFSANTLKAQHTSVLSVGIGGRTTRLRSTDNIRAVSGPVEDTDYFNTDFERLSAVLSELALQNCAGLTVTKTASPVTYSHAGQRITYHYTVTNPKFFTLHNLHVTDDHVAGHAACTPSTLATGETATCDATYTITQADVDNGRVVNHAYATGTTPNGDRVRSPLARAVVTADQAPHVALVKSAFPTTDAEPGETIRYTYQVTNTGNVTLHRVSLTDSRLGAVTCPLATLRPGESTTCEASRVTTAADVAAGHIANTAAVTGHPPAGPPVHATDAAVVQVIHAPGVQLDKAAFPAEYAVAGETIRYSYLVTNTGNVTLHGVTLADSRLGAVTCPRRSLAPAASMTCHASHVTTLADVNAGRLANSAVVTGHPLTGPPVHDTGEAVVVARQVPAIALEKSASPASYDRVGETIRYAYLVTNAGNVVLRRVTLADGRLGPIDCPRVTLDPGESMACHVSHRVTVADLDTGHITNTALATGHPPAGPPVHDGDEAAVHAVQAPHIALVKTAFPLSYHAPGQTISYAYLVTNTGNVTLHRVTLADSRLGAIGCPKRSLAPSASMTCYAAHVTTAADVDAGFISNTATVSGDPPAGPPVSDRATRTVRVAHVPGIRIQKTASPTRYSAPGETIRYTYTVVNTENVTLRGITVSDDKVAGPVTCPASGLAPGASMACHAGYVITWADVAAGHATNVAVVTGSSPSGQQVTSRAEATVTLVALPVVPVTG